jgi:hypothetical protein
MSTVRRYTAGEMRSMAEYFSGNGTYATVRAMLRQAATDATRLQSLEAENARLREALLEAVEWMDTVEPALFRIDDGSSFDSAPLTIARNALKEN